MLDMSEEFLRFRDKMIIEEEKNFEKREKKFSCFLEINFSFDDNSTWLIDLKTIEKQLKETFEDGSYWSFPDYAVGVHKDKWNRIYFKDETDAMAFKLMI